MKPLYFIFLLLICQNANARTKLELGLITCHTDSMDVAYRVKLYKGDSLYKDFYLHAYYNYQWTLKNMDTGRYVCRFTNIYGQNAADTFIVAEKDMNYHSICIDKYVSAGTFGGWMDSIKKGGAFTITYEKYGCFHWDEQRLKIENRKGNYVATLYPIYYVRKEKTGPGRPKTMQLTPEKLALINTFQQDTYEQSEPSGSTEMTFYTFAYKTAKLKFNDSQEARERFNNLVKALFL